MKRGEGIVGKHCYASCSVCGNYHLCEHNQSDASVKPRNVCTGLGFKGVCDNGQYFSCGENKDMRIVTTPQTERIK